MDESEEIVLYIRYFTPQHLRHFYPYPARMQGRSYGFTIYKLLYLILISSAIAASNTCVQRDILKREPSPARKVPGRSKPPDPQTLWATYDLQLGEPARTLYDLGQEIGHLHLTHTRSKTTNPSYTMHVVCINQAIKAYDVIRYSRGWFSLRGRASGTSLASEMDIMRDANLMMFLQRGFRAIVGTDGDLPFKPEEMDSKAGTLLRSLIESSDGGGVAAVPKMKKPFKVSDWATKPWLEL